MVAIIIVTRVVILSPLVYSGAYHNSDVSVLGSLDLVAVTQVAVVAISLDVPLSMSCSGFLLSLLYRITIRRKRRIQHI